MDNMMGESARVRRSLAPRGCSALHPHPQPSLTKAVELDLDTDGAAVRAHGWAPRTLTLTL